MNSPSGLVSIFALIVEAADLQAFDELVEEDVMMIDLLQFGNNPVDLIHHGLVTG